MIRPPFVLRVRIRNGNRRFGFWVPLFMVWPPIILLALGLFPLVLVLAALLWPTGRGKPLLLAGPLFFGLICSLRGLRVDVEGRSGQVFIALK